MTHALDARRHQLKLLKLEKRGLKPLATTLLSAAPTPAKLAAIASVSAMLLALHDAPEAFYRDLGQGAERVVTVATVTHAQSLCDALSQLVSAEVSASRLYASIEELFQLVHRSHQSAEAVAKAVGARLVEDEPGVGGGGKDDPMKWLSQLSIGLRGSLFG